MNHISIAIDGPSGAGKSTLARMAADQLGFHYVDTGAIYRTVALKVQRSGVDPQQAEAVAALLPGLDLRMEYDGDGVQRMYLDGQDVSQDIRRNEISRITSLISAIPQVRAFLLDFQRSQARMYDVVMDGRDIGSVVLPQADVKIFLTAAPEARAQRRLAELLQRGEQAEYEKVLSDIIRRDEHDTQRKEAPLRQCEDARLLDTSQLNLEESLQALLQIIREGLKNE